MKTNIGEYVIESDSIQFVVSRKSIVKEGVFTKAENIGKEVIKPVAYCVKFEEALRYIPQDTISNNDDINVIADKLNSIQEDIQALKEYPVILVKEEPKVKIVSDEETEELENE